MDALKHNPLLPYQEVLDHSMHTEDLYAHEQLSDAETIPLDPSVNYPADTALSRVENTDTRKWKGLSADEAESTFTRRRHNHRDTVNERSERRRRDQTHRHKRSRHH